MFKTLFFNRKIFVIIFTLLTVITVFNNLYPALTGNNIISEDKRYLFMIKWNEPSKLIELPSTGNSGYANVYEFPTRIKAAAMSSDSRYLATVNEHKDADTIRIYDMGKKKLINIFSGKKPMNKYIRSDIWFSHDNTGLYIPGEFGSPLIKINIFTGEITSFEMIPGLGDYNPVHVSVSPDRKFLAVEAESPQVADRGKVNYIRYLILYNVSTMKIVKYIKTDAEYDDFLRHPTDLYFTNDSKFLNYYYSAPDSGLSHFFNMSYGKGTRQYSVPDLNQTSKNFEPRTKPEETLSAGAEYVTRISDGAKFTLSSTLATDFMKDDPDFKPLSSTGKDITASSSHVYSGFPAGMSDSLKKSASANGKYTGLVQVIHSTDMNRADSKLSEKDLIIYGSIQFSGVKTEAGYKVFIPPYLFIWEKENREKKDNKPKIVTEIVSVGGMDSNRKMMYDLRVEVTYEIRIYMAGGLDLNYKYVKSAVVKEYRFSNYNAKWTKLVPAPSAYLEDDKKKWSEKDVPLFYVRINLLDIWFNLRGFKVDLN